MGRISRRSGRPAAFRQGLPTRLRKGVVRRERGGDRPTGRRRAAGAVCLGLVLALVAPPAEAGAHRCTWRVRMMPTSPGTVGGDVRGTDGGNRWVGIVSEGAALWRGGHLIRLGPGRAQDVNRHEVVVGGDNISYGAGHAVMWVHGRRIRLAEPAGVTQSAANAVNDSGEIVGYGTYEDIGTVGLVWSVRSPWRVRVLTYGRDDLNLTDVSASGLIVGVAWRRLSEMDDTVALQGTVRSGLRSIVPPSVSESSAGSVSGRYVLGGTPAGATLWRAGTRRILAVRAGILATAVNRHGLVAGFDTITYRPVIWNGRTVRHLPLPWGWSGASPMTINDAGQLGGSVNGTTVGRPVLWVCR